MLVSRDHILRLGVEKILTERRHIRLIGPSSWTATEVEEQLAREQPQIVIVDSQTERDLAGLIQRIKRLAPRAKTVLLIGFEETGCTWDAFSAGVDGVILKVQPAGVLIAYVESLCGLPEDVPEDVKSRYVNRSVQNGSVDPASLSPRQYASLTNREREILALIGQGLSNKDIADRLCISVITTRHHLTSIFNKFGVETRQKLLIRAHQYGLVEFSVPA
jgi:DNA-binding NarL/FixJ family response regulator